MILIPDPLWMEKRDEQQSIFYKIAHILKLGAGHPEQERLWTYHLRTASTDCWSALSDLGWYANPTSTKAKVEKTSSVDD
jgi:hypothetical protein